MTLIRADMKERFSILFDIWFVLRQWNDEDQKNQLCAQVNFSVPNSMT